MERMRPNEEIAIDRFPENGEVDQLGFGRESARIAAFGYSSYDRGNAPKQGKP
jgi:hypothetical protein